MFRTRKCVVGWVLLATVGSCAVSGEVSPGVAEKLQELSVRLSGRPGYFDTDNLITNEGSFQQVLPVARRYGVTGGVYVGVGPAQNFTYIAHLKPELALLVDLRADNRLLLLYLRALFIESANRQEYLAGLLGRPLGVRPDPQATAVQLASAFGDADPDPDYFESVFARCWRRVQSETPDLVADSDRQPLHDMVSDFVHYGLGLRFRSHGRPPRRDYPTLGRLLTETDGDGRYGHYLASEESYQLLRRMQIEQRIVPVVGDLAGATALPRIARLLEQRNLRLTALYVSNVEFYLFSDGRFDDFVRNVEALPADERALVIRSYFGYGYPHPLRRWGYRATSLAQYVTSFLENHRREPYYGYADLVLRDYLE